MYQAKQCIVIGHSFLKPRNARETELERFRFSGLLRFINGEYVGDVHDEAGDGHLLSVVLDPVAGKFEFTKMYHQTPVGHSPRVRYEFNNCAWIDQRRWQFSGTYRGVDERGGRFGECMCELIELDDDFGSIEQLNRFKGQFSVSKAA